MSKETAGLSIQDAWKEAEAEGTLSEEPSESADTTPAEPVQESDSEQSAVETPEEAGLFNGLEGDNKSQVEQPEDDEGLYEVSTVNGVEEVTLEELKAGYMRKADYTKKRQEDSAKAEEADKALVLYNALQQNPMETVQKLWEKVRAGQPVQPDVNSSETPTSQSADIEQMVNERVQAILAEDPRLKTIQQEREMERVNAIFKDIEDDWGLDQPISEKDKEFIINKAIEWDSSDLEAVFAKLMHQRQKAQAQAENVDSNSTSQGYGGQQSVGLQPADKPKKFGSIRDAINDTLADEGMSENDLQVAISAL